MLFFSLRCLSFLFQHYEAQEAHAQSEELPSHMEPSYRSRPITILFPWEGSCVGDDVSSIGAYALRIIAIQAAGGTGESVPGSSKVQ